MLRFALRRLLAAIPTLLLVILLAFTLVRIAPGGPFDAERGLPPEVEANIARAYHLDEPLPQQFLRYLGGVIKGDFGPSFRYSDYTVSQVIGGALPVSLSLGALAMLLALLLGLGAGALAAVRPNTLLDRALMTVAMLGISVPVFVVAPLLVLLFAVTLGWLPAGWTSGDNISRYILPVLALALPQVAYIARILRGSLIEVLASDYVRTARAQGLTTFRILVVHALRPALVPVLSHLGPAVVGVLTGSVVVEQVFGIAGLGQHFVNGALNRDYTLVLGLVILYAALIILANLIVDILYGVLDPRVRTA
ncbi:MAG: oligopeptide ABC transporter permease OppB [Pseudomonadota bacterium]